MERLRADTNPAGWRGVRNKGKVLTGRVETVVTVNLAQRHKSKG